MANRPYANKGFTILSAAFTAAGITAGAAITDLEGMNRLSIQAKFTNSAAGTSANFYVQTTFDSGANWLDIANFLYSGVESGLRLFSLDPTAVTTQYTPTSGSLSANVVKNGLLGHHLRVVRDISGTYTGGQVVVVGVARN